MGININNGRCRFNLHCFLGPNYLEIAENCISKHLNFKIFRGGMPLDPSRKLIHISVPFYFLKSGTPALDIPELCSFKLFTQKGFTDLHCYLSPLSFVCKMLTYSYLYIMSSWEWKLESNSLSDGPWNFWWSRSFKSQTLKIMLHASLQFSEG